MSLRSEDLDFIRFQKSGSPDALARVFDVTAPKLLLLAGHLTRDAGQAEDLVQTTFLHAMRDAARYDSGRPVVGWLAGILHNRALDLRRRASLRKADALAADSSQAIDPVDPADLVADREVFDSVTKAIEGLEDPYRQVLVLRLVHGLEPTAIAHALGRSPGTVRMQLKRGLERLKRVMPEQSTLLGALLCDPARGLSAVRDTVLAKAGTAAASAATAGTAATGGAASIATTTLGGVLTMKSLMTAAAAVLIAVALYAVTQRGANPQPATSVTPEVELAQVEAGPVLSTVAPAEETRTEAPELAGEVAAAERPSGEFEVRVRFASDGAVAVDVGVYVRARDGRTLGVEHRTDEQGVARFVGLPHQLHDVSVDRFERTTPVDLAAERMLEITIPKGVRVHGSVVALNDEPVPNADVYRFNQGHHDLLQWAARTDEEGKFELRDVTVDTEFYARKAGYQPSELERLRGRGSQGEAEVELQLGAYGNKLSGRIVEPNGNPVPYAWVAVGVDEDAREELDGSSKVPGDGTRMKNMDREGFFLRADESGRFASDEVPAGNALVLARPVAADAARVGWDTLWIQSGSEHELVVTLQTGAEIAGVVRDASGIPMANLKLEAEWEGTPALGQMEDDLGPWISDRIVRTAEDGSYRFSGLLPGEYDLRVLGERDELLQEELEVEAGVALRWDPVIEEYASLSVRLLDPDGEPLEGWAVAPGYTRDSDFMTELTDADGRRLLVELSAGPLRVCCYAPSAEGTFHWIPAAVRDDVRPGGHELVIQLRSDEVPNASLAGRWVGSDGKPVQNGRLRLQKSGMNSDYREVTDSEGSFLFQTLSPGKYELLANSKDYPAGTSLGSWVLGLGDQRDVGVLVLPDAGQLVVEVAADDGGALEDVELFLEAMDETAPEPNAYWLEAESVFTSGALWPGEYRLRIQAENAAPLTRTVRISLAPQTRLSVTLARGVRVPLIVRFAPSEDESRRGLFPRMRMMVLAADGALVLDRYERFSLEQGGRRESEVALHLRPGTYQASFRDVSQSEGEREVTLVVGPKASTDPIVVELP